MNIPFFNRKKKVKENLCDLQKQVDERAAELEIIDSQIESLKLEQVAMKNRIVESGRIEMQKEREDFDIALKKERASFEENILMEIATMKEQCDNYCRNKKKEAEDASVSIIKKADRIILDAKVVREQCDIYCRNKKKETEKESEAILKKAKDYYAIAEKDIELNRERCNQRFLTLMREENSRLDKKRKETEKLCKEWTKRASEVLEKAYKEKESILNGMEDYNLFVEAYQHDFAHKNIEDYITTHDDLYFRNSLDLIKTIYLKELRQKGQAISFHTPQELSSFHPLDVKPITQLCLAYFDLLCDNIIASSRKYGIEASSSKIMAVKKRLENSFDRFWVRISPEYIKYKLEYLRIMYAYEEYKVRKKEELAYQREIQREEEKAQREYERAIRQAEKDEEKARRMIEEVERKLEVERDNANKYNVLLEQINGLKDALQEAIARGERAKSMAEQTRRGYVYVISNKGSFGENVFKIGLTRRLDPTERVDELSNASVPFPFDIHAIIESEDAPLLESTLHKAFDNYKMNKTNWRKEFFKVPLDEIERVVKESGISTTFIKEYPARQFKDSGLSI